jgi:alpha-ketoglutarate-dependent taurine dioxygenase
MLDKFNEMTYMYDFFDVEHGTFPVVLTPVSGIANTSASLAEAIRCNHNAIRSMLHDNGAILVRGFNVNSASEFDHIVRGLITSQFDYTLGDSPRSKIEKNIYSSTDYPCEYPISLHQEMSYSVVHPSYLCFFCRVEPLVGGATPVANFHEIIDILPTEIVLKFSAKSLRYRRTLHGGQGLGKSWSQTFNTTDRIVVEEILSTIGAHFVWHVDGSLRIEEIVPGVIDHPVTGKKIWFNQAEQWHWSALSEEILEALKDLMPVENFPHYVEFEDGTPLEGDDLEAIRFAQERISRRFAWRQGDILFVDNFLVAHGRDPFQGPRSILVSLGT